MAELHAGVPDRVPDALGDLGGRPFELVDQQQVEIRPGAEIAPSVATDGGEGEAGDITDLVDDGAEPAVDLGGVRLRQRRADQRAVGHDAGGGGNRLHRTLGVRRIMR